MGGRQASRGNVMLWERFCWESLGSTNHVDLTLICNTDLNTIADQGHPFIEIPFSKGSGLFQQHNVSCYTAKLLEEWFMEHSNESGVVVWHPDFNSIQCYPDFNQALLEFARNTS